MAEQAIRRALISVHDKSGLDRLVPALTRRGIEIVSTGGTAKALRDLGANPIDVASVTGAPEILDGRVKTLHPAIHAGILARRDHEAHLATLKQEQITTIDLVVVNLYPFEATLERQAGMAETIEMIDIGGPAMVRAAAKNHEAVVVLVKPGDYDSLLDEMDAHHGGTTPAFRRRMATKAFSRTAAYDAAIASWLQGETGEPLPERLVIAATRRLVTRYGENPHQAGALYLTGAGGLASAEHIQGKELSFNNIADADAALELVHEFERPAVAIIKHANPCGVAIADDLVTAYRKALACDPVSAFGGIVACNRPLDRTAAAKIVEIFTEVVIAPGADPAAREVFAGKTNLRLLLTGAPEPGPGDRVIRSVAGGLLVQTADRRGWPAEVRTVTSRALEPRELDDLRFAWLVAKHVKSNAIVFARAGATLGIGAGQMSRLDSVRIAVQKATDAAGGDPSVLAGSVIASDAFFPFADGLEAALASGATAVVQPGGSVRDAEVIAAADARGAAMVFTGERHFRH